MNQADSQPQAVFPEIALFMVSKFQGEVSGEFRVLKCITMDEVRVMVAHILASTRIEDPESDYVHVFIGDNCKTFKRELLKKLGAYAADPEMTLTWYDAAIASNKLPREL